MVKYFLLVCKLIRLRYFAILVISSVQADFPRPWQMNLQSPATPVMERIVTLHHYILIVITGIAILVGGLLLYAMWRFRASKNPLPSKRSHHITLEIMWTAIPAFILAIIAIPSLKLLYYMDKAQEAPITVKVTGHQWYWEYEYIDPNPAYNFNFNSYMIPKEKLKPTDLRLLSVDEEVVVPINTNIRILLTSGDVLHSWAVPSFGIKRDTVPGRLSETWINVTKPGKYYGQCSELCGSGHGFMSIVVRAVPMAEYNIWLKSKRPKSLPAATQPVLNKKNENDAVKPAAVPNKEQVKQPISVKNSVAPTQEHSPQFEKKQANKK